MKRLVAGLGVAVALATAGVASGQPGAPPPPTAPPIASSPGWGPPSPGWGPPAPSWGPPAPSWGAPSLASAPATDTGPYYADVAGWSTVLATTLPMIGGFLLVGVARREGSNFPVVVEEEIGMQAAGLVMVGLGLVAGPSVAQFYVGDTLRGLAGAGLRLLTIGGGAGLIVGGVGLIADDRDDRPAGAVLMALGAASSSVGFGLVIWDLLDAPEAARRANREHRENERNELLPNIDVGAGSLRLRWRY